MKKILRTLVSIGAFLLALAEDAVLLIVDSFAKKQGFEAEFGQVHEIARRYNKGFLIDRHSKLTRRKSFENVLIVGPTGSGKTTRILLKNLYELKNCSIIVNDPSGELREMASGYLAQFFEVKSLNYSDSFSSSGFNILTRVKKINDVYKIADMLIRETVSGGNDPFWSLQAKALLVAIIRLVLLQDETYRNMANVLYLLNQFSVSPEAVDQWVVKTEDQELILEYKSIINMPEKTLSNVVATAKAALFCFMDPEIKKVVSHDSIRFEDLRKKPTVIFLNNSVSSQKYISTLNSIFFIQLYGFILDRLPGKDELDLVMLIDETSSLFIDDLAKYIANTRKFRVANMLVIQALGQMKTFYKDEAANIISNCVTQIYLPGQTSLDTLKDIETISGKFIHKDKDGNERVRPLITIDEIRMLPENRSLMISGNHPLIKGRTSPYFKSWKYSGYAKISPAPLVSQIPDEPITLIPEIKMEVSNENKK